MGKCFSKPEPPARPLPESRQPPPKSQPPPEPRQSPLEPRQPPRREPPPKKLPTPRQPAPQHLAPLKPPRQRSHRSFDAPGFCDRMHDLGRAYRCRANELIKICRSFAAASEQSIVQDTELSSVLERCDRAIERAVRLRNEKTCQEADELFDDAIRDLKEYDATFHHRRANVNNMMMRAKQDDEKNMHRHRDRSRDKALIEVEFHILPSLTSENPTVVRQVLSGDSGDSVLNEILWNFSHYEDERRLSLAQNPRFYAGLPATLDDYDDMFSSRPTESYNGAIYVLTNNSHRIFFEFDGSVRAFDNVWNTNNILIFRDVVGRLEGEASVERSIPASPTFVYRREPPRHEPEEFRSWDDILRRLRDRLRESSLSHWHVRLSARS